MPVRTAYDAVTGEVLTATNLDRYPGGWIGYAEVTASQSTITTEVDLTGLTAAVTVGPGRRISITAVGLFLSTIASDTAVLSIKEGATQLTFALAQLSTVVGDAESLSAQVVLTPTTGAHTYKLTARRAGTGSMTLSASATAPVFILIEDIGPAA